MAKRNLTREESFGEEAFVMHKLISENELKRRKLLLENINLLERMRDGLFYTAVLGDEEAEWVAYLGQIEVFYTRSLIIRLLRVKRNFLDKFGFDIDTVLQIPHTRLEQISSLQLTNRKDAEEVLELAKTMLNRDWNQEVKSRLGKITMEDCETHEFKTFQICKNCSLKQKLEK